MKLYIIFFLIGIIFIAGCGNDCSSSEQSVVTLAAEVQALKNTNANLVSTCGQQKIVYKEPTIASCQSICPAQTTTKANVSCIAYVNKVKDLEANLESCWEEEHEDYRDLYQDCREDRRDLREENNNTIIDLEDDLKECFEDLETCESDLNDC